MWPGINRRVLFFILVVILQGSATSDAAIVIALDHETVFPGETARVGVFISSDTADIMTGFNLPMDIGGSMIGNAGDGRGPLPLGFTLNPLPVQNIFYPDTKYDIPGSVVPANVDAIPVGTGDDVTLSVAPLRLFDLVVDVASNVTPGTVVPIRIMIPANGLQSLFNIDGSAANPTRFVLSPSIGVPSLGSITVVPEPGAFWLLLLVTVGSGVTVACWLPSRNKPRVYSLARCACEGDTVEPRFSLAHASG